MKKLTVVFATLLMLVFVTGCNTRTDTMRFNTETDTAVKDETATESKDSEGMVTGVTVMLGEITVDLADERLKTYKNYNVVWGTAPKDTHSIKINSYTLQQFKPGQNKWSYIVSTGLGNMKEGENQFMVYALAADGSVIDSQGFEVVYEIPAIPVLPGVGAGVLLPLLLSIMLSAMAMIVLGPKAQNRNY